MKLSTDTIKILQNFAAINPNVILDSGKVVKTISEAKNIFASADIAEDFEGKIGIYDLNEFLSALSLIDSPDLTFDGKVLTLTSESGKAGLKYACANPSILTAPPREMKDPSYEVSFTLAYSVIQSIKKAASVFKYETISFKSESGETDILACVSDPQNSSSNVFSEVVGTTDEDTVFNFNFNIANLKLMPADYDVYLSARNISKWESSETSIRYWIAIEEGSNYKQD